MFLARSICSDLNGSRRADRRTGTNAERKCAGCKTDWLENRQAFL